MRNKIIRKKNLSQPEILSDFFNLAKNDEERLFYKLVSSIKCIKRKPNNIRLRNTINNNNNYYKSNTINNKTLIKKSLESNINLSKEYNNFCGSFLFPDYTFASGKKILKDLKSNGVEKTINKHFIKKIPKANYIKKSNVYSITKKRHNSVLKSKYNNLIQSNNSHSNINNSLIIKNNKKYINNIKYDKFNNYILPDRKKRIIIFEYNAKKDNKIKKKKIENAINSTIINRNSFCKQNTNNSKSHLSSSTSCNSKKIRNIKMLL